MNETACLVAGRQVLQAAAVACIAAFDLPIFAIHDPDRRREIKAPMWLGDTCKFAIHPARIAAIDRASAPPAYQIAGAPPIVAAGEWGGGAVHIDGRIDVPVVKSARPTVARAAQDRLIKTHRQEQQHE